MEELTKNQPNCWRSRGRNKKKECKTIKRTKIRWQDGRGGQGNDKGPTTSDNKNENESDDDDDKVREVCTRTLHAHHMHAHKDMKVLAHTHADKPTHTHIDTKALVQPHGRQMTQTTTQRNEV